MDITWNNVKITIPSTYFKSRQKRKTSSYINTLLDPDRNEKVSIRIAFSLTIKEGRTNRIQGGPATIIYKDIHNTRVPA